MPIVIKKRTRTVTFILRANADPEWLNIPVAEMTDSQRLDALKYLEQRVNRQVLSLRANRSES